MTADLEFLGILARSAGAAILEVYETEFNVEKKADHSPLTLADTRSHHVICQGLQAQFPDIPVLSEEGKSIPHAVRRNWKQFWLVDPLDGTKEFVKRNGEFTVNIALIEERQPLLGVIYIPVADRLYLADTRQGCWELSSAGERRLHIRPPLPSSRIRVARSRSHPSPDLEALLNRLPDHETISRGSAAKFCAIAAGQAEFYPRLGPTWEWDTAAGQAIVMAAGGVVLDLEGNALSYNKEDLLNGPFLVAPSLAWLEQMGMLRNSRR
jgi:3'(2'), 5'-bisphosphate nucleotidase